MGWKRVRHDWVIELTDSDQCEVISHCSSDLHFSNNKQYWASFHVFIRMRLEQLSTWIRSSCKTLKIHIWNSSNYPWSHCHFRDSVKINRHLKKLVIEHDHSSKPRDKMVWEMYFRNSLEIWKSLILFLQIMRIHKFHSRINALNFFTRLELFTMYLNLAITAILL